MSKANTANPTDQNNDHNSSSQILWDKNSLSDALGLNIEIDFKATGVAIDSRKVQPDEIFIGIKGENFDGSDFANLALENGASLALVNKINTNTSLNDPRIIVVDDTLKALTKLGVYARSRIKGKLIAVTGSVGKTSTKEMLRLAFQNQGRVYASYGNFNNHIGLPLCLSNMPQDTEFAVFELGMNHAGEISHLSKLAVPDIAIITTVEAVHLEFFKSVAGIAEAKSEIFHGMKEGGFAIINYDNPYHQILVKEALNRKLQIVGFSETQKNPAKLIAYELKNGVSHIKAEILGKEISYTLNSPGKHLALNSIAVVAAVKLAGAELEFAAKSLCLFNAIKGRGEIISFRDYTLIDETYNASPAAVRAALANLAAYKDKGKRLVAILGDMRELGNLSKSLHEELAGDIYDLGIDIVYTVGELMSNLHVLLKDRVKGLHAANSEEMAQKIIEHLRPQDVILVKGSRGVKMEKIIEAIAKQQNS